MVTADPSVRICTAHNRKGEPCKRKPCKGTNVCMMHGGLAPQVQAKAAQRLAALIDPELPKVAQRIKEGLDAMETKFFQKDGIVTDSRDVIAWGERRGYIETAMKALQITLDKNNQPAEPVKIIMEFIGR